MKSVTPSWTEVIVKIEFAEEPIKIKSHYISRRQPIDREYHERGKALDQT